MFGLEDAKDVFRRATDGDFAVVADDGAFDQNRVFDHELEPIAG